MSNKKYFFLVILFFLMFMPVTYADQVVTFKAGINEIPPEIRNQLQAVPYKIKKAWTENRFVIQNLPKTVWDRALRQPNLAIKIEENESFVSIDLNHEAVESVTKNHTLTDYADHTDYALGEEDAFSLPECDGYTYSINQNSFANQRITTENNCDNFSVRPRVDFTYRVKVSSSVELGVEVYQHGEKIASGTSRTPIDVRFNFGHRQKYITVKALNGDVDTNYRLEFFPIDSAAEDLNMSEFILYDGFANTYGFGIPKASIELDKDILGDVKWAGAKMMEVDALWANGITGKGIKVAIVDTGIKADHPFFEGKVVGGYSPFGGDYLDSDGHGTHVAGIVHQVAPDAQLLAVRVFPNEEESDDGASATQDVITKGIKWAIDQGADVINLSLGGLKASKGFRQVFEYGASRGVLFAMASGNNRGTEPLFPAKFAGDISGLGFSVGATDEWGQVAVFSNWTGENRNMNQLVSHGVRVLSADAFSDGFVNMSGTSMAAPQLAGYLALYKQMFSGLSGNQIQEKIALTAKHAIVAD